MLLETKKYNAINASLIVIRSILKCGQGIPVGSNPLFVREHGRLIVNWWHTYPWCNNKQQIVVILTLLLIPLLGALSVVAILKEHYKVNTGGRNQEHMKVVWYVRPSICVNELVSSDSNWTNNKFILR